MDFWKVFKYKFSWKFFQWEPSYSMRTGGRTDRQTDMTKLIFVFRKIESVPKISISFSQERGQHVQDELYITTYSRFGPWVIGVTFGYVIYEAKKKELKLSPVMSHYYYYYYYYCCYWRHRAEVNIYVSLKVIYRFMRSEIFFSCYYKCYCPQACDVMQTDISLSTFRRKRVPQNHTSSWRRQRISWKRRYAGIIVDYTASHAGRENFSTTHR